MKHLSLIIDKRKVEGHAGSWLSETDIRFLLSCGDSSIFRQSITTVLGEDNCLMLYDLIYEEV